MRRELERLLYGTGRVKPPPPAEEARLGWGWTWETAQAFRHVRRIKRALRRR